MKSGNPAASFREEIEMAPLDQFIIPQGWNVMDWHAPHRNGTGVIPRNGFKKHGTLTIRLASPVTEEICNLSWGNDLGESCSIKDLPFHNAAGRLKSRGPILVTFGEETALVEVTLFIREETNELIGEFTDVEVDGNKGTFIAEANPPVDGKPA